MRRSSSSTTERRVDGFRLVRETAHAGATVTYEAVQEALDRPSTVVLLTPGDPRAGRFRAEAWPEHPHVVSLYAAGATEDGFFIATQHVPGATTLRAQIAAGADPQRWLADVRATLAATGAVHGALEDEASLLVDGGGRVLITGFGLAPEATPDDDERALTRLGASAAPRPRRRRAAGIAVALIAAAVVAAVLAVALRRDDADRVPAPALGALALGSALAAGEARTADCDGGAPSGSSLSCTVMQTALAGRTLIVPGDGRIVAWHVRGARGRVAVRVIRDRGTAGFDVVGGSGPEVVDGGLHSFPADVPVRAGDRVGLELAPGSGGGFRAAVPGAATTRFVDALRTVPRPPNPSAGTGRDEELLLRVDVLPGAAAAPPEALGGAAAASAPAGRRIDERVIDVAGGARVTTRLVALGDGVAVDVVAAARRRARIAVAGADPQGRPVMFTAKGEPDLTLAWRNPGGQVLETRYRVTARSIAPLR